jgi:hypothetical protein
MSNQELHTTSSHLETAATALGSVYAANEFAQALEDNSNDADEHYVKAAIGTLVALGAYHKLSKKASHESMEGLPSDPRADHHRRRSSERHHNRRLSDSSGENTPPHHTRHLVEEAAGAYSLGKELLTGDKKHHVVHLVAEALGATGLIKDIMNKKAAGE